MLNINPDRQIPLSTVTTVNNYWEDANSIVQVRLPSYFYPAYVASCLVPGNKVNINDLPLTIIPDCRRGNIGSAERRFVTRSFFGMLLIEAHTDYTVPVHNVVGIKISSM